MCTVTFVNNNGTLILTSNRDEHIARQVEAEPTVAKLGDKEILFPKEPKAGGTWFAADNSHTIAVLLNGAFEKHKHKPPYRLSRGIVLLNLIAQPDTLQAFKNYDLIGIEPFTIILLQGKKLYQLRWDEQTKYAQEKPIDEPHIWSSATLYSPDIVKMREQWFYDFLLKNPTPTKETMREFHSNTQKNDTTNGLIINRNNILKTLSITQAYVEKGILNMHHANMLSGKVYHKTIQKKHV